MKEVITSLSPEVKEELIWESVGGEGEHSGLKEKNEVELGLGLYVIETVDTTGQDTTLQEERAMPEIKLHVPLHLPALIWAGW